MPEYTYLLETRLTAAQQNALAQVRDAARDAGMVVFLTGGAVRDLTTGSSVRDLDFSVQGNALDLEEAVRARGARVLGSHTPSRTLFLWFPGSVRVELTSTRTESYPKPGKPVYTWAGIVDDLFRRDFTVNAMALSLNEGSYGLLLDPLNGVADTEARQLRLVSNYGFLEDPSRLVRAIRLALRLGWNMEERTAVRYQNAKEADNFDVVSAFLRGYELEEVAAEEDALAAMRALEAEGLLTKLAPGWMSSHADTAALENLHRNRIQLLMQGIAPDLTAVHMELLTAKMKPAARSELKDAMARPGLREQWENLNEATKEFARLLSGKDASAPSAAWKLFHEHAAEPVLWLAHSGRGSSEAKFKRLFHVWPEIAKKVPVTLMSELRIVPELPVYPELLHTLFLEQIDGRLQTDEEMRAFLEKYSPPAPPPPVSLKRSRSRKTEAKGKRRGAAAEPDETRRAQDDSEDVNRIAAAEQEKADEQPDSEQEEVAPEPPRKPAKTAPEVPASVKRSREAEAATAGKTVPAKTATTTKKPTQAPAQKKVLAPVSAKVPSAAKKSSAPPAKKGTPKPEPAKKSVGTPAKKAAALKKSVPAKKGAAQKRVVPAKGPARKHAAPAKPARVPAVSAKSRQSAAKKVASPAKKTPGAKAAPAHLKTAARKAKPARKR